MQDEYKIKMGHGGCRTYAKANLTQKIIWTHKEHQRSKSSMKRNRTHTDVCVCVFMCACVCTFGLNY